MKAKLLRGFGILLATSPVTGMVAWAVYDIGWRPVLIALGCVLAIFCVGVAGMAALYLADQLERRPRRGLKRR